MKKSFLGMFLALGMLAGSASAFDFNWGGASSAPVNSGVQKTVAMPGGYTQAAAQAECFDKLFVPETKTYDPRGAWAACVQGRIGPALTVSQDGSKLLVAKDSATPVSCTAKGVVRGSAVVWEPIPATCSQ